MEQPDDLQSQADGSDSPPSWKPYVGVLLAIIAVSWALAHWPKRSAPSAAGQQEVATASPSNASGPRGGPKNVPVAERIEPVLESASQRPREAKPLDTTGPSHASFGSEPATSPGSLPVTESRPLGSDPTAPAPLIAQLPQFPRVPTQGIQTIPPATPSSAAAPAVTAPGDADSRLDATERPEWLSQLEELGRQYRVEIVWKEGAALTSDVRVAFPSSDALAQYVPSLATQLKKYPAGFLRSAGLQKLVLCQGLPRDSRRRATLAHSATHTLYLDVAAGLRNQQDARLAIHHGVFRLLDDGSGGSREDAGWTRLNPAGFQYQANASSTGSDVDIPLPAAQPPGFISRYATTGAAEDRAEVFAHWMADHEGLRKRISIDAVLAEKTQYIRGLVDRSYTGAPFLADVRPAVDRVASDAPPTLPASKPSAGPVQPPNAWPRFLRRLQSGDHEMRIQNPNPTSVKVGLRSGGDGIDVDVPAEKSRSVFVPSGTYDMYFWYTNKPEEVYQGDKVPLTSPGQGVQIQLVAVVGGNYGLRPVGK